MSGNVTPSMLNKVLEHGKHVEKLAGALFTSLSPLHGLGAFWESVLCQAALYHDIGWLQGEEGHHKSSGKLLRATCVPLAAEVQRPFVALVARYHKGALPCVRHKRFAALTAQAQNAVFALCAILRLADALDFTHTACVSGVQAENVLCDAKTPILLLLTCAQADTRVCCQAEIERVKEKSDAFSAYYKRSLVCQIQK